MHRAAISTLPLMGIGGAWVADLAALEPMRPFFMGATLLFVALYALVTTEMTNGMSVSSLIPERPSFGSSC